MERSKDIEKAKKELEREENREMRTIREASIMLLLHHPYIVSLEEMMLIEPYYYMLMEYVNGGQLLDYIIAHGRLKEKNARRFARQIVSALGKSNPIRI
jgi:serine/threonine protein kinase KIN1/2